MLVIGAGGFAKEVLEDLGQDYKSLAFYDDVSSKDHDFLNNRFKILRSLEEAEKYFQENGSDFCIGIGNPSLRFKINRKFSAIGGNLKSTISRLATIGSYDIEIGTGTNVLSNSTISNSVKIGIGCIVYYGAIITHDCNVGDFVEISPGATLLGKVTVGAFSQLGARSTILPNVKIGENVIIGAGAVVTRDVQSNTTVAGVPARLIRNLKPISIENE